MYAIICTTPKHICHIVSFHLLFFIKEINKKLTNYKHIKNIIITDEPMIKTTTNKVKRKEEMKKILK